MWNKFVPDIPVKKGFIVFVHGSSMASQPTFDLYVDGRPFSSAMNYFAVLVMTPGVLIWKAMAVR
tara:strand:- start:1055 stop:1249 length:195 start_codon:yes stop_codon:yes gene_type:complete